MKYRGSELRGSPVFALDPPKVQFSEGQGHSKSRHHSCVSENLEYLSLFPIVGLITQTFLTQQLKIQFSDASGLRAPGIQIIIQANEIVKRLLLFPHCQHGVNLPNNASHLVDDFFEMTIFAGQLLHQFVVFVQSRAIRFAAFLFQF